MPQHGRSRYKICTRVPTQLTAYSQLTISLRVYPEPDTDSRIYVRTYPYPSNGREINTVKFPRRSVLSRGGHYSLSLSSGLSKCAPCGLHLVCPGELRLPCPAASVPTRKTLRALAAVRKSVCIPGVSRLCPHRGPGGVGRPRGRHPQTRLTASLTASHPSPGTLVYPPEFEALRIDSDGSGLRRPAGGSEQPI